MYPHYDTTGMPLRREIAAIGAAMAQMLREGLADGDYEVQENAEAKLTLKVSDDAGIWTINIKDLSA